MIPPTVRQICSSTASTFEAQTLWRDTHRSEVPARTTDEPRRMVIGQVGGKVWSAVVTYRDERIRIISVRPSRENEVALYEG